MQPHFTTAEPSPAQRAWMTRRAVADARLRQETIAKGVETPAPIGNARLVTMFVDDHPTIGCGQRFFVVVELGPSWVLLFQPTSLQTMRVDRLTFDKYAKRERRADPERVANIIRNSLALADRVNSEAGKEILPDGGLFAGRALEVLR